METKGGMMQIVAYGVLVQWTMQVKKKKSNPLCNFLLLVQFLYDLFKYNFCIKTIPFIIDISYYIYLFYFFKLPKYFSELSWKRNPIFIRPVVGVTVCNTAMDHLFVNNAAQLLVEHIIQWGQYGRRTQSLCSVNGCSGCMLGGPQEHCPWSRCSVMRLMPTVHSWQSVSSPPTTVCHWRCGKRRLNCGLNPAAAGGPSAFDLFLLYAWKPLQPLLPGEEKKWKCFPLVTDLEWLKLNGRA